MNVRQPVLTAAVLGIACVLPSLASAALINVGSIQLLPNTAGQTVMFFGSGLGGSEQVGGLEFDIQVGDGGAAIGGTDTGPTITAIDLISGTPWEFAAGVNQANPVETPLARQSTVDFGGSVALTDNSRIATVTFDTTGITSSQIELLLEGVGPGAIFNTKFFTSAGADIATDVTNGSIQVGSTAAIPEPSSILLMALAGCAIGGWQYRRRRKVA
jgi:hypothetical protein